MEFIDTHSHIYSNEFAIDSDATYQRELEKGVTKVLLPNINLETVSILHETCKRAPNHYLPMMGLHPCEVKDDYKVVLEDIYRFLITNHYFGIGEIGMDLYWDKTTYENQYDAFRIQAKWAIERDLPVSIHSRDATQELIDLIVKEELNELRGVFHCFTGDETQARTIIDMGFYLGIGGVVTYKNSTLPDVLEKVGIEHLVLETDAPYLPPVPHRGKRNEPSYIPLIAEKLALIFKLSLAEVAEITTNNSRKVFGI
jgi:TatD DNase family protein